MYYIPTDERAFSDEALFASLDLSSINLVDVKNKYQKGLMSEAKQALVDYFHTRQSVTYLFDYRSDNDKKIPYEVFPFNFQASLGLNENIKNFCLKAADKLMNNTYIMPGSKRGEYYLGEKFEFPLHYNYLTDQATGHRGTFSIFSRGQFFEYLMFLYHENHDEKIVKKFEEYLDFFWRTYPLQVQNTKSDANRLQFDEDRDVMNLGWLIIVYMGLLYTELLYKADTEYSFGLIKHLVFAGLQFCRFSSDSYRPYNHHYFERGIVPFFLGTVLSEFTPFKGMQEIGSNICLKHIKEDFSKDGGYNEHSLGYWYGAALAEMTYRVVNLAKLNSYPLLDEDAFSRLDNTFDIFSYLVFTPDFLLSLGDNPGPMVEMIARLGLVMTNNSNCKKVLDNLKKDKTEEITNPLFYANNEVGFVISKNREINPSGYIMSAKRDCGGSGHNHMDMLSLNLCFNGKWFVSEPYSGVMYGKAKMFSPQRGYHYNMTSHNSVLCYGRTIQGDECYNYRYGVYKPDSIITSKELYKEGSFVESYHNGYTYCSHIRRVLHSFNGNLFVQDEIDRANRLPEDHIQRWNLTAMVSVEKVANNCLLLIQGDTKVLVFWKNARKIEVYKQTEILKSVFSEEQIGYTIDVSFGYDREEKDVDVTRHVFLNTLFIELKEGEQFDKALVEKKLNSLLSLLKDNKESALAQLQ
ncbi:MAG: hypothetical protein GX903_05485 [Spirochaetales bacterium]|nr:hypothetical protein [Spirochaetales bacterium]